MPRLYPDLEPVYESWNRLHAVRGVELGYGVAVPRPIPLTEMEAEARRHCDDAEDVNDWIDYLRVLEDCYLADVRGKLDGHGAAESSEPRI